jgi:uncharacterized membrane protein YhdT
MTGIFCVCLFSYSVLLEVKNTYLDRASGHAARKHCSFAVLCLTAWMVHDFTVGTVNCMVGLNARPPWCKFICLVPRIVLYYAG